MRPSISGSLCCTDAGVCFPKALRSTSTLSIFATPSPRFRDGNRVKKLLTLALLYEGKGVTSKGIGRGIRRFSGGCLRHLPKSGRESNGGHSGRKRGVAAAFLRLAKDSDFCKYIRAFAGQVGQCLGDNTGNRADG